MTQYWLAHYCGDVCTLCGNTGRLDTRSARSPLGVPVGRVHYCLCPNGQAMRAVGTPLDGATVFIDAGLDGICTMTTPNGAVLEGWTVENVDELRQLVAEAIAIIDTPDGVGIPVVEMTRWLRRARAALDQPAHEMDPGGGFGHEARKP